MDETPEQGPNPDNETPPDFDPLLQQAERLPSFVKGSEGNDHTGHVQDPKGDEGEDDGFIEDGFGYTPPDPGSFTAD